MGDDQVTQKVPPLLIPPVKRVSKRLAFFWVHFFHTRSGGSIQTPLTNGGPFCPLLGGDPSPREGGTPQFGVLKFVENFMSKSWFQKCPNFDHFWGSKLLCRH